MADLELPDGYSRPKCLREKPHGSVYTAVRDDGREVVLKAYHRGSRLKDEAQARREFEALEAVAGPGVPAALELMLGRSPPLSVIERVPGITLTQWCPARSGIDPAHFLEVAVQLAAVFVRVHAKHLLHRDVTPDNILVDPSTRLAHLIDFGLTKPLGVAAHRHGGSTGSGEFGGLRYIAPEQTGRMNRGCDFRSDLYSLGAVFYRLLVGRPPFEANDPLELIHAHIARLPEPPSALQPGIPDALSRLVLKLLSKAPEARYQSAKALHADLEMCSEQLRRGAIDSSFALGSSELPERPRFSRRLQGRETESALLRGAFAECARGATRVLLLRGEAGVGKSTLVDDLRPLLAESRGYLASGKFDLYRDRPFAGWAAAIESLVQQLLLESDEQLGRWREQLRARLGNIAGALVDLVPDLAFVLGEVPRVPALGPGETQARLALALQRFVGACATPEHPFVLFLDDLQWSDAGSRALLEELLCGEPSGALLLIAAYRSSELDAAHPLTALLERLAARRVALLILDVLPLGGDAVIRMLAEALERTPDDVRGLAGIIERKTGNAPLLVQEFIDHIHECKMLRYQRGVGWTWDVAEITAADVPDGAVALVTAKLRHLTQESREVLQLASCVGDEFDLELLSELGRHRRTLLEGALYALCDAGVIAACTNGFRFVHDRIREAAQALLSEGERAQLHAEIALFLLAHIAEPDQPARVFEIVDHLNRGRAHVPGELRLRAIELNLLAGKRALASGAGATAAGYLAVAREIFSEADWGTKRELGIDLHLQSAEGAFQSGEYKLALELLDTLEARPLDRMELAQSAAKRLRILPLVEVPEVCVRILLKVLRQLGVRWPLNPSRTRAHLTLRLASWTLALRGTGRMLEPATSRDPRLLAPLLVITPGGPSMALHNVHLSGLSMGWALRRYLRFGHLGSPSYPLAAFAAYYYVLLGGPELARRRARLALEVNERFPNPVYGPRAEHVVHALIHPWLMRRREALAPMGRVAEAIRETGDPEFFQYARFISTLYGGLAGDPVPETERRLRELAQSSSSDRPWYEAGARSARTYRMLLEATDDAELERELSADAQIEFSPYVSVVWLLVLCIYGRHDLAFDESERVDAWVFRATPFVHVADHTFYRGLAAAQVASHARGARRRRCLRALRASLRKLRLWARGGPDFEHMVWMLEAERARLKGRATRALELYERAAQRALKQEFVHHAALAHEHRARLLERERRDTLAAVARSQAARLYQQWGASAKVAALSRMAGSD